MVCLGLFVPLEPPECAEQAGHPVLDRAEGETPRKEQAPGRGLKIQEEGPNLRAGGPKGPADSTLTVQCTLPAIFLSPS